MRLLVSLLLLAAPLAAQPGAAPPARPTLGVALSGGGARGLAHVGALQALERAGYAPGVVAGTSMGAVVGGLYAAGWGPDAVDSVATSVDWSRAFSDAPERSDRLLPHRIAQAPAVLRLDLGAGVTLPRALLSGQRVGTLLSALTWPVRSTTDFGELPVPFAAIATDFETGEAVRLTSGSLAQAMRASLALPVAFEPVRMNGRLLVDGGLSRNLPAEDARALGADVLVCVDVTQQPLAADSVATLTDVLLQTTTLGLTPVARAQRARCDVLVRPDLGDLGGADFDRADTLSARGFRAMRDALPELRALLPPAAPDRPLGRVPSGRARAAVACAVRVDGLERVSAALARRHLGLPRRVDTLTVTPARADRWTARLVGTGSFERVAYRLEPVRGGCPTLVFDVEERTRGTVGLAVRFDSERRGAALLSFGQPGAFGTARLDTRLRLGRDVAARTALSGPLGTSAALTWEAALAYEESPAFSGAADLGRLRAEAVFAEVRVAHLRRDRAGLGVALSGEAFRTRDEPDPLLAEDGLYGSASLLGAYRSLDDNVFPTRGASAAARADAAAGTHAFGRWAARARAFVPLGRWPLVAFGRTAAGRATRGAPPHRLFALGGVGLAPPTLEQAFDLAGERAEALAGRAFVLAGVGVRWDAGAGRHLALLLDAARVGATWNALPDADTRGGWGVVGSQETPLGPLELAVSGWDGAPTLQIAIGYRF